MSVPITDILRQQGVINGRVGGRLASAAVQAADMLDAINALHLKTRSDPKGYYPDPWCPTCRTAWPCPTARLLHPGTDQ